MIKISKKNVLFDFDLCSEKSHTLSVYPKYNDDENDQETKQKIDKKKICKT